MKKIKHFLSIPLTLLMALVFSTSVFAQGNQPNTNTIKQSLDKQGEQNQKVLSNEVVLYPWTYYKDIDDPIILKQTWITENGRAYRDMMPTGEAVISNQSTTEAIPVNDLCGDAISLTYGLAVTGSTSEATPDANCPNFGTSYGVWYKFTATTTYTELSTCGATSYDSYLSVYSGPCGSLVCEAQNDDACGLQSRVEFSTNIGQEYYVLVHGFSSSTGSYELVLNTATPPPPPPPPATADPNPSLGQPCPLRLVLVLDESGSISGNESFVRSGVNAFVSGLEGTGTEMAIIEFTNIASRTSINGSNGFQTVDATYETEVAAYLPTGYVPGGGTNWAAAFDEVFALNNDEGTADLVIFFTDGFSSLQPAIVASNAVKGQGSRIFMLGVGPGADIGNLIGVSGPLQAPPTPLATADYGVQADFADIEASLIALSTAFLTDYYADNDGDGFGAGPPTNECAGGLAGYVLNNDDCDDTDPNVYPGAPEICDGKDNDCSGSLDDADCDGVEDLCDVCPGGDDSIDADGDGNPDCATEPQIYDASWECDNKGKKITICHVDGYGNRFELCVSKNAAAGHLGHGDYLGPCIDCGGAKTAAILHQGELILNAYPVPVVDYLYAEVTTAESATALVTLTDYLGRIVLEEEFDLQAGENTLEINASAISAGVYLLNVNTESVSKAIKITVQ